nr:MAG TPA: hypothetical protein [Caudoviricetes sp.]
MLKIGDKIKYVNANPFIEFPLGTVCKVTNIKDTAIEIVGDYKVDGNIVGQIQGVMSYDEYKKYFKKSFEKTHEWTDWIIYDLCSVNNAMINDCRFCFCDDVCAYCDNDIYYKHNGKRLVMKTLIPPNSVYPNGKVIRVCANCSPVDTFNLDTGIKVALMRLAKKLAKDKIKYLENKIKNI